MGQTFWSGLVRIKYLLAACVIWFGFFSFGATAQTCLQQGGTLLGCVSPLGMTYGNGTVGYFSSEMAAVQAQAQYSLTNEIKCKECYNLGVIFAPYDYERWSCTGNIIQENDSGYTKIGPEGKSPQIYSWVYDTKVFIHGMVTGNCQGQTKNSTFQTYYRSLHTQTVYAYIRCPANYQRTQGSIDLTKPYLGYLCKPRAARFIDTPQTDFPNKDCADYNTMGQRSTKNPISLSSKCKNEVVEDLSVSNAPYPLKWLRFAGQQNARGVWSFENGRRLTVSIAPMTSGSHVGKDIAAVDRRNGSSLVYTADPVSNGPRQWKSTGSTPTTLQETFHNNQRSWRIHQRNGEVETYNKDGTLIRKTSPTGHNHHYIYTYTDPTSAGDGSQLSQIRDDFGNVLTLSYNPGYNSTTSVPAFSSNNTQYSSTLLGLLSTSLPQQISDGTRTVSYSWNTDYVSAFMQTTPQLLAVESPDGGITEYFYGETFPGYTYTSKYALTGEADQEGQRFKTYQHTDNSTSTFYLAEWMGAGPDGVGALEKTTFDTTKLVDQDGNTFGMTNTGTYTRYSQKCPDCKGEGPLQQYYRYASNGLYETENWSGVKNSIVYDEFGRVVKTIAASNKSVAQTVEYTYDPNSVYREPLSKIENVLSNGNPHKRTTTYTYTNLPAAYGSLSPCAGAYGGVEVPCPATRRLLTKISVAVDDGSPLREMAISYTPYGLKDTIITPTGQVIKHQWNERGQLMGVTYGYGTAQAQTYTYGGHTAYGPSYMIAPNNLVTMWVRDINGRVVEERVGTQSGALGVVVNGVFVPNTGGVWRTSVYHWRLNNLLDWAQLPDGRKVSFAYDGARRITQMIVSGADNSVLSTRALTWSPAGSLLNTQVRNANNTVEWNDSAVYNAVRDVSKLVDGNNNATTLGYNSNFLNTSVTTPLSNTHSQGLDSLDRPISFTDALGNVASLTYGPQNEIVRAKDQRLVETSYAYNGFGDVTTISSPDRGTWGFTYNAGGQLLTTTDPRNVVTTNTYDALGRLVSRQSEGGSGEGLNSASLTDHFTYGSCGVDKICSITDGSGTTTYAYNVYGEITRIEWNDGNGALTQSYTYSPEGRVASLTYPSGKVLAVEYGANSLPTSLVYDATAVVANIQWTSFDAVRKWTWGQSTGWSGSQGHVQFTYDLTGQPTSISDVDDRALLFDADGRLVGVNDANALYSQLYAYDKNARLTRADIGKWDTAQIYSYDAAGNRISLKDEQSLSGWRYGYGLNSNRLTDITAVVSVGSGVPNTPTYDTMGNMISDGQGQSLTYNTQGRLSAVDQTVYTYNAQGQRQTKDNGTKRAFIHDPMGRLLGEYVWNGSLWVTHSEYIYLDNWRAVAVVRPDPITQMNTPRIHPIVSDHLGTPRKVLDGATGQTLWSWDAKDPFGNEAPNENPSGMGAFTLDLRFPGQQFDTESGFFHNGFRTYHPKWGRYIQSDPLGLEAGWNTYVYVNNNPLTATDPEGLSALVYYYVMYFQPIKHEYSGRKYLCTVGSNCSRSRAEESLRNNAYPGQGRHEPVTVTETNRWVLQSQPISTQDFGDCIKNTTRPGHIFHNGYVKRSIVENNGNLYIDTYGSGTNTGLFRWTLNMITWQPGFYFYDKNIQNDATGK